MTKITKFFKTFINNFVLMPANELLGSLRNKYFLTFLNSTALRR